MGQSIGLLFGIGTIFFGWKLANILWDSRTANKVGWALALFPSLILYSVLFLREVYIGFFLILAVYGVVNWIKTDSYKSIVLSLMGFIGATLFHGPMLAGAIIFLIVLAATYFKRMLISLVNLKFDLKIFTIFLSCIILIFDSS